MPVLHELPDVLLLSLSNYLNFSENQIHSNSIVHNNIAYCGFMLFSCSGIQPVKWLFCTFLRSILDNNYYLFSGISVITWKVYSYYVNIDLKETHRSSRGRLARTFMVPVNWLFCRYLRKGRQSKSKIQLTPCKILAARIKINKTFTSCSCL